MKKKIFIHHGSKKYFELKQFWNKTITAPINLCHIFVYQHGFQCIIQRNSFYLKIDFSLLEMQQNAQYKNKPFFPIFSSVVALFWPVVYEP